MNIRYFLAALTAAVFISCSPKEKIETLFNGENLDGWKVVLKAAEGETFEGETFYAQDGVLRVSGKPFGYIRTEKKYTDYTLHLEWRWAGEEGVDGGVFNRLQDGDKVWPLGVQLQMTPKDMGVLMGGIKIEGLEGPFYKTGLWRKAPRSLWASGMRWNFSAKEERSKYGSTESSSTRPSVTPQTAT